MIIPKIHRKDGLSDINNSDFQINEADFKIDRSKYAVQALIDCVSKHQYNGEPGEVDDRIV